MVEERTSADSAREPLGLRKADDKWAEVVLKCIVIKIAADLSERKSGLLTHDRLVRLRKCFQKVQEGSFVWDEIPDVAQLLGDGKENFVILFCDQIYNARRRRRLG